MDVAVLILKLRHLENNSPFWGDTLYTELKSKAAISL